MLRFNSSLTEVKAVEARKDGQIPVLSMKHAAIAEMRAYTDLDDLKKAVNGGNLPARHAIQSEVARHVKELRRAQGGEEQPWGVQDPVPVDADGQD